MTNEEALTLQKEYRRFTETVAGKALHLFRNRLVKEVMAGELERTSMKRNQENEAATNEQFDILVAEIKRLQAIEANL